MPYCLPIQLANIFKRGLKDGTINPEKLNKMTSKERHSFFADMLGEDAAKNVNALFESKLLLKHQQTGFINWAKKTVGLVPEVKRDIISRVQKIEEVLNAKTEKTYLEDFASKRLGIDVSFEEAKAIADLSKSMSEKKAKITDDMPNSNTERLDYGTDLVKFQELIRDLKLKTVHLTPADFLKPKNWGNVFYGIAGATKSMLSTLDNSFFGRQGIKMLFTNPDIWANAFIKSWKDMGKELAGQDAMLPIKAEIYSRKNAINGKYARSKLDIGILSEEAYPSSLPGKIPGFGRAFKAAESAYNGAALRMRADLMDRMIQKAERQGIDILADTANAEGIGQLVNSMTGRGSLGKAAPLGKEINATLFSGKFLKSNFDTLTMHLADPKATPFVKKQAAQNMAKIIIGTAAVLVVADRLVPGSVEKDPRSSNFGKIKIGNRTFDLTGGMGSILTLAARILVPTMHNGELGLWTKSGITGKYTKLNINKYGAQTALDMAENFLEGKLAPFPAGLVRDVWQGQTFQGKPITVPEILKDMTLPISVQTFMQLTKDPNKSGIIVSMIAEGLGINLNVQVPTTDWSQSTGKELLQFKEKVGEDKFKEANDKFNTQYSEWINKVRQIESYKNLSEDDKQKLIDKKKAEIKANIFEEYDFEYEQEKEETSEETEKTLEELMK